MTPPYFPLLSLSLSLLILQTLIPSTAAQLNIGIPPISLGIPPISLGTPPISISTPPINIGLDISFIRGSTFCDKCLDGGFTATEDGPVSGAAVTVNCTISTPLGPVFVVSAGVTASDGTFALPLSPTTASLLLTSLYTGGIPGLGPLPGTFLAGCKVQLDSPSCPTIILTDGTCNSLGIEGNGYTSGVSLVNLGATSADISINTEICNAPLVKDVTCPLLGSPPSTTPPPPSLPGGTGDPHYTGADGSRFDFSGEPNTTYCLISDSHLHINVFYGGRYGQWGDNPHKSLTWIRELGILWGHHTVSFTARSGSRWQYDSGYMAKLEIDGEEVKLSQAGDSVQRVNGKIELTWLASKIRSANDLIDIYELTISDVLKLRVTLRPEVQNLRTETDGLVHMDFEIPVISVSERAHGILGQTFRLDHKDRLAKQNLEYSELLHTYIIPGDNGEGFLDGAIDNYRSSTLLRADCQFARFTRASSLDIETSKAVELMSVGGKSILGDPNRMSQFYLRGS